MTGDGKARCVGIIAHVHPFDAAQVVGLCRAVVDARSRAQQAGSTSPIWDDLIDAHALLGGKQTLRQGTPAEVYAAVLAALEEGGK